MKPSMFILSLFAFLFTFVAIPQAKADNPVIVDIQLQNNFIEDLDLNDLNRKIVSNIEVRNDVVSMSGGYGRWSSNFCYPTIGIECEPEQKTIEQWTHGQIMNNYKNAFLTNPSRLNLSHDELDRFEKVVIFDHEHPLHTRNMGDYIDDDEAFNSIVYELKRRYAAMRAVTPNAKFAWYALVPNGMSDESWDKTIEALIRATDMGMFENVDYIIVNLYPRWCPDHPRVRSGQVETKVVDRGMALANVVSNMEHAKGHELKIYPLMSFKKFGEQCVGEPGQSELEVLMPYHEIQMSHLLENFKVDRYGFWEAQEHEPARSYTIDEAFLTVYGEKTSPGTEAHLARDEMAEPDLPISGRLQKAVERPRGPRDATPPVSLQTKQKLKHNRSSNIGSYGSGHIIYNNAIKD